MGVHGSMRKLWNWSIGLDIARVKSKNKTLRIYSSMCGVGEAVSFSAT